MTKDKQQKLNKRLVQFNAAMKCNEDLSKWSIEDLKNVFQLLKQKDDSPMPTKKSELLDLCLRFMRTRRIPQGPTGNTETTQDAVTGPNVEIDAAAV